MARYLRTNPLQSAKHRRQLSAIRNRRAAKPTASLQQPEFPSCRGRENATYHGESRGRGQTFASPGTAATTAALLASELATNYNQEQIDVLFDATSKLLLRGGYRFVW